MKVKCIRNNDGAGSLKVGAIYDVNDEDELHYYVALNGATVGFGYYKDRFEVVPDAPPIPSWSPERGPQMASPKGRTIFKYQMPVLEQFELQLPQGAQIIRIQDQGGMFWLWAVVDLRKPNETRRFRAFKTGADIPDDFDTSNYVGFCAVHVQMELGLYIFEQE